MNEKKVFSYEWAGRPLVVEVGQLAKQANGAAMIRYGETAVLATATMSKQPKALDFFPLTVNFEERLYAAGKIPGGFIKREGRPSEAAVLTSRLIDRPIRPMFPDGFRNEVQSILMVMSNDSNCPADVAAMFSSSLSLAISDIPFDGPIAGVHVGYIDGEFVVNPTVEQSAKSTVHLTVAGNKDAVNMVEAGALEVTEDIMLEAIMFGHEEIKKLIEFQEQIVAEVGKEKLEVTLYELDADLTAAIKAECEADMNTAIQTVDKQLRQENITAVKTRVIEAYEAQEADEATMKQVNAILDKMVKDEVRRLITEDKVRPDGRKQDEIRPLSSEVDLLPRAHGSAL